MNFVKAKPVPDHIKKLRTAIRDQRLMEDEDSPKSRWGDVLHPYHLTATDTGAYKNGRRTGPVGRIRPDYRVMFDGIKRALEKEMAIVFVTSSRAAIYELAKRHEQSGLTWHIRYLGEREFVERSNRDEPIFYSRGAYEIMEVWGL